MKTNVLVYVKDLRKVNNLQQFDVIQPIYKKCIDVNNSDGKL